MVLGGFRWLCGLIRFLDGFDRFQVVFGRLDVFSYDFLHFFRIFCFLHLAPPARAGTSSIVSDLQFPT